MVCEDCGARHYSAAAETLTARGERCERCSGLLVLREDEGRERATRREEGEVVVLAPKWSRGA
jgi:hypothetical protein